MERIEQVLRGKIHEIKRAVVPGLKEQENLQDAISKFSQVKDQLAAYGCRTDFPDGSTVSVVIQKQDEEVIRDLFKQVDLVLPRKQKDLVAEMLYHAALAESTVDGIIPEKQFKKAMNEKDLIIFRGKTNKEAREAFKIEPPKAGDGYGI